MNRQRWLMIAISLLGTMLFYVIWNTDYTNYARLQEISETNDGGRTGQLKWEIHSCTEHYSQTLLFDPMWESIQTEAAAVTDLYERLTGRSREWFELTVETNGVQIRAEDIQNLPTQQVDRFQTNGAIVTTELAKAISQLRHCKALELRRIDDQPETIDYLTRIPELRELTISPETFTNPQGSLKRFKGLKYITVIDDSKGITKALVAEIVSHPTIVTIAFHNCKFEPGAPQVLNGATSVQLIELNNCQDADNFGLLDIKKMTGLFYLSLTRVKLAPHWIESLAGSQISYLELADLEIPGCLSSTVNQLPNIKDISLQNVSGSCLSLAEIDPKCPVETFYGGDLKLDFASFQRMAALPRIESMTTENWNLPENDFLNLRPSPSLRLLSISNAGISPEVQKAFYEKHPSISNGHLECLEAPD